MRYNHEIDHTIVDTLLARGKCNFADLKKITGITGRTLSAHLKRLEEKNVLKRDNIKNGEWKFGRGRFSYLTEGAKQEIQLGIFKGIQTRRESRSNDDAYSQERKREKPLQLVLLLGSSPAGRFRKKPNMDAGNLVVFEKELEGKVPYEVIGCVEGIAISDLLDKDVQPVLPLNVFAHVQCTRNELEYLIDRLQKYEPAPIIKACEQLRQDEYRYVVSDHCLCECITQIWLLFGLVYQCLSATWKYVRGPKPRERKEWKWYRFFFGESEARLHFTRLEEDRRRMLNNEKLLERHGIKNAPRKLRKQFLKKLEEQERRPFEQAAVKKKNEIMERYKIVMDRYRSIIRSILHRIYSPLGSL